MIEILNNIFFSNGYTQVKTELSLINAAIYLFRPSEKIDREEYFVTVQLKIQSNTEAQTLNDKAQEIFEAISKYHEVSQSFEKNCTMLICHEEDMIDRKTILTLEEDPYNFKKNIITYTAGEITALEDYLSKNDIKKLTNQKINSIINSNGGSDFVNFKNNQDRIKNHYSLIMKIALKIPFIAYTPQEQNLNSLVNEIEESLSNNYRFIYNKLMESNEDWTDDEINRITSIIWSKPK